MTKEIKIILAIALGAIAFGLLLFKFASSPAEQVNPLLEERSGAYFKGDPEASVTVTEFADFQCPACRSAAVLKDKLLEDYPNNVKVVFRHFPLAGHSHAQTAAQVVEAAGDQGKFWEMHDLLFLNQDEWGSSIPRAKTRNEVLEIFEGYARELELNVEEFLEALKSNKHMAVINRDMSDGRAAGVTGTPQFYVNGLRISSPSYEEITAQIERALNP